MEGLAIGAAKEVGKTAITAALGSLGELIKSEVGLEDTVKEGLITLKEELEMMEASILDVSSRPQDQITSAGKTWLNKVKELSDTIQTGLQSFASRMKLTKDDPFPAVSRQSINREMHKFIEQKMSRATQVSELCRRYCFGSSQTTTSAQRVDPRLLALFRKESELVGLQDATNKLIQRLEKRDHVSIVGMGGIGKTTLALAVYGKLAISGNFDFHAFVPVGQHANVEKVLMDIVEDLHIPIHYCNPDRRQLTKLLQDSLKGKRCLFVIDDVWEDNTWDLIQCALLVGTPESRIITTSRNVEVAKPVRVDVAKPVDGVYKIGPLSHASSEELLHTRLFGPEDRTQYPEFFSLFDKILSKCGGVPLAIIAIAGLLAKKPREEWSKVYDSIGFGEHEDVEKDIWTILSYSYYDLPPTRQKCFLSLGKFPEGQWIEKNMLIWSWVAEDLVPGGLFSRGEEYFNELTQRSMIQRAMSPRDLGQGGCRIHKIMLDLIRRLCEKEKFSTVIGTKQQESTSQTRTIHRLAIHKTRVDEPPTENTDTSLDVGEVISFYASTCSSSSLPPLSEFRRLRVIDLESCDLSDGDRKLEQLAKSHELAYLGLSGTIVAELPKEIGELKLLQTLDVTGTGIKELPLFVEALKKKIRCLRAGKGTIMKDSVGELTSLEELWLHSADKSPKFASELENLTELRVLVVHFDEMDEGMWNILVKSLSNLNKLQILQIWCDTDENVQFSSKSGTVPYEELQQLQQMLLFRVILPNDTPWTHSCAKNLSKLLLQVQTLLDVQLDILGKMPFLLSLHIHSEEGNLLSYTALKGTFKVLEYLYINIELVCGEGGLPRMQELEVAGIRVGTDAGLSENNMPLLERATYHLDCMFCGPEEVRKAEAKLRQESEGHPNHPAVSIKRFNNLGLEMHNQLVGSMPELMKEVIAHFRSAGSNVKTNTNSLLHDFLEIPAITDVICKVVAQSTATVGAPPTLAVGDAGKGSSSPSSSQSPLVKICTCGTKSHLVESMAHDLGMDAAAISNMLDSLINSPEGVAMMNNTMRKKDGSLPASEATRVIQSMVLAIISQLEQNGGLLESCTRTPPSPMIMMMLMSSAMSVAANSTGSTQERNDQIDQINADSLLAAFDGWIASNPMPGLAGMNAADCRSMGEKSTQNPEFVECIKSLGRNVGGPQFSSDLSTVAKLFMSQVDLPAESGKAGKHAAEHTCADVRRESLPEVTADGLLTWLETQDGAAFLSETAACLRMSSVAFKKLVEKHAQKPEMIASLNSARQSMGFCGMARLLMQQLAPDIMGHFFGQVRPMASSTSGGGGPAGGSGMLSGLLSNLAVGSQMADPTAQLASMHAAARSSASVAPLTSQDAENLSRMLKQLLPAVEHNMAASPSSKPDNVGIKEGGTD